MHIKSFFTPNLDGEHSAILSTFIKLPFAIKIFVLSILSGRFTQALLYLMHQRAQCMDVYKGLYQGFAEYVGMGLYQMHLSHDMRFPTV